MREIMKGFFTVLKWCAPDICFLLLTGVSKFSKAGVFSNLNHLYDISIDNRFSTLLGITEEKLKTYFQDYIQALGEKEKLSYNETSGKIRDWYNGYKFSEEIFRVLGNIFSNVDYAIQIEQEKYYQTIFYLIFHLLGVYIRTEVYTNVGRIDAVIEGQSIYIFEFKLNGSKEEALEQINKQKYYEKYLDLSKRIYL